MQPFEGMVGIVSGATRSMGAAIVERLASQGMAMAGFGRSESGEQVAERIRARGGRAIFVRTDIASEEAVAGAMDQVVAELGRIDVLVNNAAASDLLRGTGERPVAEEPTEVFDRLIKVNVYGAFFLAKYAIPHMVHSGGGSIVNISSISAHRVYRSSPGYATSKAALEGLTRQIAMDYADLGVRANTIILGSILSPETAAAFSDPAINAARRNNRMVAEPTNPEEVAALVSFLVSADSRYITAASIPLEGGALATYPGTVLGAKNS